MSWMNKLKLGAASAIVIGVPALTSTGCDEISDAAGALCCEDYKPGQAMASIDWGLEGQANVQFGVFMQAIGDLSVTASGIITAVGVECQAMAQAMNPDVTTPEGGDSDDAKTRAEAWCAVAFQAVADVKASANLTIEFEPPSCKVEASAQANCEASCQVDASCEGGEVSARCDPGQLSGSCEAECSGKCEGEAGVAVECEGTCSARCTGECSGTCKGQCDGTCSARNAEGECEGTCEGTCSGSCDASCSGKCEGSCQAEAGASVQCSGKCTGGCSVEMKAPSCEAELTPPSCEADANCSGGCKASASAKAECKPPSLTISASGAVDASIEGKITAMKIHLPKLLAQLVGKVELVKGNVEFLFNASADLAASGSLDAAAGLCILKASEDIEVALGNLEASATLSIDLVGKLGG